MPGVSGMISRVGVRHCWRYSQRRVVLLVQAHDLAVPAPADPAQVDRPVHRDEVALQDVGLVVDLAVGVVAEAVAADGQDHPQRHVRAECEHRQSSPLTGHPTPNPPSTTMHTPNATSARTSGSTTKMMTAIRNASASGGFESRSDEPGEDRAQEPDADRRQPQDTRLGDRREDRCHHEHADEVADDHEDRFRVRPASADRLGRYRPRGGDLARVVSGVGGRPAKRVFRERVAVGPHVLGEGQHAGIAVRLPTGPGARTGRWRRRRSPGSAGFRRRSLRHS